MTIVIPPAPPPPSRRTPSLFAQRTDELLAWMPGGVAGMNAQNAENNALASAAAASAQTAAGHVLTAAGHAQAASTSATAAAALANFKGAWSGLTGALNTPASVLHLGQVWMLLNNLANVASAEPGSNSASWFAVVRPQRPDIKPSISVDWTLKPTAASLVAAGWTISRASEMTYFGQAPVKVAENLLVESRSFGANWDKTARPVVMTPVTHASGLQGFRMVATVENIGHGLGRQMSAGTYLPGQTYRVRFLVKAGAYTKVQICDSNQGRATARFDLTAGALLTSGGTGYVSHSITPHELGGGLYWCELVMTSADTGGWTVRIGGYPDTGATLTNNDIVYIGDGTSGIEVYAAQLQQGLDSHFVETTSAPVTLYARPLLTAPAHELAYQHSASGDCLGLLSYPAATNVCLRSQDLGHVSWTRLGVNVTLTKRLWAGFDPFYRVEKNDALTSRGLYQMCFQPAAGSTWTATMVLMGDYWSGTTSADLRLSGVESGSNGLDTEVSAAILSGPGELGKGGTGSQHRVTGLSFTEPTLVRITRTYPLNESSNRSIWVYPGTSASTTTGAAILATRVQVESGANATPYIPTTTAAATRAAQTVTLAGSAFAAVANPAQGTLLARASVENAVWAGAMVPLDVEHASSASGFQHALATGATSNALQATTTDRSSTQADLSLSNVWGTNPVTVAYSYRANAFQAAAEGALSALDTSGSLPAVTRFVVGGPPAWAGCIQRTELYPRALTAAELSAITTPGVLV
jgi:hypothetical protein